MAIVQEGESEHQPDEGQTDVGQLEICQPDRLGCFA
jgi:hypothetical protein